LIYVQEIILKSNPKTFMTIGKAQNTTKNETLKSNFILISVNLNFIAHITTKLETIKSMFFNDSTGKYR